MNKTNVTKDTKNKTLIIDRLIDAPPQRVWDAYSQKDLFEQWWGPEGWETTVKEFDFKVGGRVHYCMKCVDKNQGEWYGKESWGLMEILTVDAPNSFSARDFFSDESGSKNPDMPEQKFEVEFQDQDGKTLLINKSILESVEQMEELIKMGMVEGFSSQLNRLEKLMEA